MTDFPQAFQNDHNNVDAVNEIGPPVSQVIPSQSAKSHYFDAHGGNYSVNVNPS